MDGELGELVDAVAAWHQAAALEANQGMASPPPSES